MSLACPWDGWKSKFLLPFPGGCETKKRISLASSVPSSCAKSCLTSRPNDKRDPTGWRLSTTRSPIHDQRRVPRQKQTLKLGFGHIPWKETRQQKWWCSFYSGETRWVLLLKSCCGGGKQFIWLKWKALYIYIHIQIRLRPACVKFWCKDSLKSSDLLTCKTHKQSIFQTTPPTTKSSSRK